MKGWAAPRAGLLEKKKFLAPAVNLTFPVSPWCTDFAGYPTPALLLIKAHDKNIVNEYILL